MKVTYEIDIPSLAEDLYQAFITGPEYKKLLRIRFKFYFMMMLGLALILLGSQLNPYIWIVFASTIVFAVPLILFLLKKSYQKSMLQSCQLMFGGREELTLSITKKQIEVIRKTSDARFDWAAIEELKKAKKHWIIKFEGNTILPVPHKAFKTAKERKQFEAYFKDINSTNDESK